MTAYLDVMLRGLALMGQACAVGGVLFVLVVLRTGRDDGPGAPPAGRAFRLIMAGAAALALAQVGSLTLHLAALADDRGWPVRDAVATAYFRAGLVRILGAAVIAAAVAWLARAPAAAAPRAVLVGAALVVAVAAGWLSHASARMEERGLLLVLDTAHQLTASVWIGGLAQLIAAAVGRDPAPWPPRLLKRFSALALTSVAGLIAAGIGLSLGYLDGLGGLLGTSYGIMVLVKVAMLAALMGLGGANFLEVRRLAETTTAPLQVRRFVEVELGLGLTVLFAAASLTSLPPAVDVVTDRATFAEVLTRFTPRLPTLTSPPIEALPVDDREAPRTDEDRAWSEYNHHVAGLFVIAMGLLAIMQRFDGARWARHWPLLFLGLSIFMLLRNDPGSWPLGPQGFAEGFYQIEVVQHRVFVLLVVGFGIFEWMVRTGRLRARAAALVFPLLCIVGGAMLLTHSHSTINVKQEFLTEVTHAPLGVLALVTGWGRWLELRLPAPAGRLPGWMWAGSFTLIGVLLVFYRES